MSRTSIKKRQSAILKGKEAPSSSIEERYNSKDLLDSDEEEMRNRRQAKCIIEPNNSFKVKWDVYVMTCMIIACILIPWQLAFVDEEGTGWIIINNVIDATFLADIIVTFFTAYMDDHRLGHMITDRKVIAKKYIKFWFWLDLISIVPFDRILETVDDLGDMAKFTKVGRMYKMIRMLRMIKMVRVIKDR